jgi:hypothetical protein
MNKPITIIREEVKQGIADIINNSGLPAFIIEPIIQEFLVEVRNVAKLQYERDLEQYNLQLKTSEKTDSLNKDN